jgi:hypothetical protein
MGDFGDALVFLAVVALRVIVPLFIFRYPLPAIVVALVVDAVDETVFQVLTNLNLENYQSYDKALDVYYLAIAYIATMRNWSNLFAVRVSRFLWYFRLMGSTLFEFTGLRALLMIFPNVFEYFFIYVEAARTRWNIRRLTRWHVVAAAAIIWVFIKLPQEYWIHVAQLDFTDFLKETVLGAPADASWADALRENLWFIPVLVLLIALAVVAYRVVLDKLPASDFPPTLDADVNADEFATAKPVSRSARHWQEGLLEKVVLVSLISVIFAQMLPNVVVTTLQLVIGIGVVVAANAFVSHWLATRGTEWEAVGTEFVVMAGINLVIGLVYVFLLPTFDGEIRWRDLLFFTFLLTLLVTLYDRYRPIYDLRVAHEERKFRENERGSAE